MVTILLCKFVMMIRSNRLKALRAEPVHMSTTFSDGCVGDGACDVDDGGDNDVGEGDNSDNEGDSSTISDENRQPEMDIITFLQDHHRTNPETPRGG